MESLVRTDYFHSLCPVIQPVSSAVALGQDGDIKSIKEHHNQIIRPENPMNI